MQYSTFETKIVNYENWKWLNINKVTKKNIKQVKFLMIVKICDNHFVFLYKTKNEKQDARIIDYLVKNELVTFVKEREYNNYEYHEMILSNKLLTAKK